MTALELAAREPSIKLMTVDGVKKTMSRSSYGINPHNIGDPDVDVARFANTRGAKLMRNE